MSKNGRPKIDTNASQKLGQIPGTLILEALWADCVPKGWILAAAFGSNSVKLNAKINIDKILHLIPLQSLGTLIYDLGVCIYDCMHV